MGIDVTENKEILFNADHDKMLITDPAKNPQFSVKGDLQIQSIFGRSKKGDYKRDGNPFIYALKNTNGFSIDKRELYKFRTTIDEILNKIISEKSWDCVLAMPSSHNVSDFLARRISRRTKSNLVEGYFSKKTIKEVITEIELNAIPKKHRHSVKLQLRRLRRVSFGASLSMKNIENKIRPYFRPIGRNVDYCGPKLSGRILLVDDLLSTGSTLVSAQECLVENGVDCTDAICLLSDLK